MSLCVSCAVGPAGKPEAFVAAPSAIDERMNDATIEDYIVALPAYAYHEEGVKQFEARVRQARTTEKKNEGKGQDYLFVACDGCWPSKDFKLDRATRELTIRIYQWEPVPDYTETMRRVPGGWMRGPRIEIRSAEQAVSSDGHKPSRSNPPADSTAPVGAHQTLA